ncbi:MAG: ATP-binding protein [Myxococcota bacterium]
MPPFPNAQLALVLLTSVTAGIIGLLAHRAGQRALGFWILGWGALLSSATLILAGPIRDELTPISYLFSSMVSPLMMMGAYAYSRRPEPLWAIPLAGLLGVLRLAFSQIGVPEGASIIAAVSEPIFAFAAAYLVLTRRNRPLFEPQIGEQLLAVSLVYFGFIEIADVYSRAIGGASGIFWPMWLSACAPLFMLQVALQLNQLARKEREAELESQATARRLDFLLSSENDVLVELDTNGKIHYLSSNTSQYTQVPNSAMIGKNVLNFADVGDRGGLLGILKKNGHITEAEIEGLRLKPRPPIPVEIEGESNYFESSISTYSIPGRGLRLVAGIRNVTQRVQQEETIRQNTLRLNRAEEIAGVGSWELDPATGRIHCSPQFASLYGLDPSQSTIPVEILQERVHPEDRGGVAQEGWAEITANPDRFETQFRIIRPTDDALLYVRVLGEIERDASGKMARVIGATLDITEQHALEERLRQGKQQFDLFVQSDIVGVFFMDTKGAIQNANPAFLSMLGYAENDLPLEWNALTPTNDQAREKATLDEILDGATPQPYEKEFLKKSGERASALVAGAGLGSNQAIVLAVDVTERKNAEQYIERYQRELEETVALRTNELLESRNRLAETERLAAVGTLAAGVAHQINNPIGAILNSAEYALLCQKDEDAQQIFTRVLQDNLDEAKRCAQIVRSMLQFSRDQPAERWEEDLRTVSRRAHRSILPYAADCGASVELEFPRFPLVAQISPIEIEQAIVNALRNSIESGPRGTSISISLEQRDKNAYIEVIDNGRGIRKKELERLFDPFYSTRTQVGGTGLGLSVAHGIIKAHAGEIHVESTVGSGTRLVMTLPIIDLEVRNDEEHDRES